MWCRKRNPSRNAARKKLMVSNSIDSTMPTVVRIASDAASISSASSAALHHVAGTEIGVGRKDRSGAHRKGQHSTTTIIQVDPEAVRTRVFLRGESTSGCTSDPKRHAHFGQARADVGGCPRSIRGIIGLRSWRPAPRQHQDRRPRGAHRSSPDGSTILRRSALSGISLITAFSIIIGCASSQITSTPKAGTAVNIAAL